MSKLESPSSKDALCQVNLINVFSLFRNSLTLEKDGPFIWTNVNPLHPRMHCASLKLAQWFWRRRCFNFVNVFMLFRNCLALEKGGALHLNKLESPSPKDAVCQVWLKLAQWFWRRRWKCEKFTDRWTVGLTTDDRWSEKFTWAFSSGELKRQTPYIKKDCFQNKH